MEQKVMEQQNSFFKNRLFYIVLFSNHETFNEPWCSVLRILPTTEFQVNYDTLLEYCAFQECFMRSKKNNI